MSVTNWTNFSNVIVMTVEKDQRNASKSPILNIEYEDEQVRTEIPAILDTGAQLSIVGQNIAKRLNWKITPFDITLTGINGPDNPIKTSGYVNLMIRPEGSKKEYLVQLYVLIQERNNILFGNDIIKLLKLIIIPMKTQIYQIVRINQSGQIMEISKCEMRPLSEEEITKLAEADTPAKVPNMERLQKIAEMYPADDNCVVMETLMQNINSQLETQDRRMIKEFLFDNLDIFATHKFDVGKVSHDKLNVVIEIGNRPACKRTKV